LREASSAREPSKIEATHHPMSCEELNIKIRMKS
jgi:hypothetical protein